MRRDNKNIPVFGKEKFVEEKLTLKLGSKSYVSVHNFGFILSCTNCSKLFTRINLYHYGTILFLSVVFDQGK